MIRWFVLLVTFGFGCAGLDFLVLAISTARSGLGIADYGPLLALGVVLFSVSLPIGVKVQLPKN